jgi:hypothetical protein
MVASESGVRLLKVPECTHAVERLVEKSSNSASTTTAAEEALPMEQHALAQLRELLPADLAWRTADDLLASLPRSAEPHAVARLRLGADAEVVQEDVSGACWVQLLLPMAATAGAVAGQPPPPSAPAATIEDEYANFMAELSGGPSVQWMVIPGESKRGAAKVWRRHLRRFAAEQGGDGVARWPTATELADAGVDGVEERTQSAGEVLLLPPYALAVRRAGPNGADLLQWCRAPAGPLAPSVAPSPASGVSCYSSSHPHWRRLQMLPSVSLAAFSHLTALLGVAADEEAEVRSDADASKLSARRGAREKAVRALLRPCAALIDAETLEWERRGRRPSPPEGLHPPQEGIVSVRTLSDHAPRACDRCKAEVFNRCVRIAAPWVRASGRRGRAGERHVPEPASFNPRRRTQRHPGEEGDFCLRKHLRRLRSIPSHLRPAQTPARPPPAA